MTAKRKKPKTPAPATPAATPKRAGAGLKSWHKDLIACGVIYLAIVVMFHEVVLQGRAFTIGDDTVAATALNQFAAREAENGEYPLWCPEMFGGFPSFAAGAYSTYEHMGPPYSLANRWLSPRYWVDVITIKGLLFGGELGSDTGGADWMVALMLYGGLLVFLLLRRLGLNVYIALFAGLVFAWNPYLFSIVTAAHGGKLMTFIYTPLIILLTWNLLENRRLFDLGLLAVGLGWQIAVGGHTQILFYSGLTMVAICLTWAIYEIRAGNSLRVGKAALLVVVALVLAAGIGSLWYVPLFNYVDYSIRGMGPAIGSADQAGYSLEQATMWSMMPGELITFIFPSWYGLKSPYYWGGMPFTSSSFYFGIVPLLFAVLALFGKKTRLMWSLIGLSIFSILLSFGKHFESLYALFFNYFPFFNKFRTPSLILLLIVLAGIILSGYGIRFVTELKGNERWKKVFLYGAVACAAVLVLAMIGGPSILGAFASFVKEGEAGRYSAQQLSQLQAIRAEMLQKEIALVMVWLGLAFAACYLYVAGRVKATVMTLALIAIAVLDLWFFSNQFFDTQRRENALAGLKTNRIVDYLKQDNSHFRVFPIGRLNQDNRWVAWDIDSFGGYHGAKLRSWQDIQDNVLFAGPDRRFPLHISYLSAMNCKYMVSDQILPRAALLDSVMADPAAGMILYRNPRAKERVYFVDSVIVIADRAETIRRLMQPDLTYETVAVIDSATPGPVHRDRIRQATITRYTPHEVAINARNELPTMLVLADTYYEPGWAATVDGRPAHIYRVNGYVRGLYLQPGDHSIIFRYTGEHEHDGVLLATVSYFVAIGVVLAGVWRIRRKRGQSA